MQEQQKINSEKITSRPQGNGGQAKANSESEPDDQRPHFQKQSLRAPTVGGRHQELPNNHSLRSPLHRKRKHRRVRLSGEHVHAFNADHLKETLPHKCRQHRGQHRKAQDGRRPPLLLLHTPVQGLLHQPPLPESQEPRDHQRQD